MCVMPTGGKVKSNRAKAPVWCFGWHGSTACVRFVASGTSIASKKMIALAAGGLDAVAQRRGITNRADDDDLGE